MATYKVLQDIEAEDKLIGPLTLKQFIFAIITIGCIFAAFMTTKIPTNFSVLLALPWLLPISFFGFMATPISKDQPNDVWLAARIRFLIKPRKRVWDQAGMQELVTINAPKKIEIARTDGLNQGEVKSRLNALSGLMDTRGWAVKNLDAAPSPMTLNPNGLRFGERLMELARPVGEAQYRDMHASDDMLDPMNNMIAQRIDAAIKQQQTDKINSLKEMLSTGKITGAPKLIREEAVSAEPVDYSFLSDNSVTTEPGYAAFGAKVVSPGTQSAQTNTQEVGSSITEPEESAFLEKVHRNQELSKEIRKSSHEHVINPISEPKDDINKPELTTVNQAPDAILKQLGQANDLSVASLANLAKHAEQESSFNDNDVISLH